MQKFLFALMLTVGFSSLALAKEFPIPDEETGYASVEIPKGWKPKAYNKGVEAVSKDGEVYLSVEAIGSDSLDESLAEAMAYLKKQGVTVDDSTAKTEESTLSGMAVVYTNWAGKDKYGDCRVALSIIAVTKGKGLLVIYWASPEGDQANAAALDAIANSIKPL